MIVTIDGHAGSGKSSAAARLAQELGFELLNTGAMYRAVAWATLRAGVTLDPTRLDLPRIATLTECLALVCHRDQVSVDGVDISAAIHTESIGQAASFLSQFTEVRRPLQARQREFAIGRDLIAEGRDQGSVVFPHAECKFFFTASVDLRARRRALQLGLPCDEVALDQLGREIAARDKADAGRAVDPLIVPVGAMTIDTTDQTPDQILHTMIVAVRSCLPH